MPGQVMEDSDLAGGEGAFGSNSGEEGVECFEKFTNGR
jgi:hypothetical protein